MLRDPRCPNCHAFLLPEDLDCGNCGRKLVPTGVPGPVLALYLLIGAAAALFVTFCTAR